MAALLARGGIGAAVLYKPVLVLVAGAVAVIAWRTLPRVGLTLLVVGNLLVALAVANNLWWLLR
jgi:hypothetical protein